MSTVKVVSGIVNAGGKSAPLSKAALLSATRKVPSLLTSPGLEIGIKSLARAPKVADELGRRS